MEQAIQENPSNNISPADDAEWIVRGRQLTKVFSLHTRSANSLKEFILSGGSGEIVPHTALDHVSLTVPPATSLAVVGSNGSGKSTLLKLISGVLQPTAGSIETRGRIAALLELGAGFHHDLTGMENIFLQGAILGLSREEILDRLDAILDFAELGPFIHTPMKRYSSGMVIRLGFALAVMSDAQTLLIDEVLAVGDAAFQAKCLRKIAELRQQGRAILFVSHTLEHVELVAEQILWLEAGRVLAYGPASEVLGQMQAEQAAHAAEQVDDSVDLSNRRHTVAMGASPGGSRTRARRARIEAVTFRGTDGAPRQWFAPGEPFDVEVEIDAFEPVDVLDIDIGFTYQGRLPIAILSSEVSGQTLRGLSGRYRFTARLEDGLPVRPERYRVTVALCRSHRPMDIYDMHLETYAVQIRGRLDPADPAIMDAPVG